MTQHSNPVADRPLENVSGRRRIRVLVGLLICAGAASHLFSLRWGFLYDDYIHQFMLRRIEHGDPARAWGLFDFGVRPGPGHPLFEWGFYPWWTDPDFKIRFFRPVSSLSIAADYRLYGDWAPGYHLTSLGLFVVLLVMVYRLYLALELPGTALAWAMAVMALSDIHTLPVGWIANRNALWVAIFLVAMLLSLHACRVRPRSTMLVSVVVCFLLACGAKESGIIGLPVAFLHEWLYPRGASGPSLRDRLAAVVKSRPLAALVLAAGAYVCWYTSAGYGTQSLLYPTPWRDPGQYFSRLASIMPVAVVSLFIGFSADVAAALRESMPWVLPAAAIVSIAVFWILGRTIRWTPAAFLGLGLALFSFIPEAGADPSDRLFLNTSIGTSILIGLLLHHVGRWSVALRERRIAQLTLAMIVVFRGLVLPLPGTLLRGHFFSRMGELDRAAIAAADIDRDRPEPRHVLVLNSPSSLLSITQLATWTVIHKDPGTRIHLLQMGRRGLLWHREDDRRITLTSLGAPFGDQRFERLFRTGRPVEPGMIHCRTSAFAAIPLDVEPNGVRRVLLEFDRSLDDDVYQFIVWQEGRFARTSPPQIGETREVSEIPSPFFLVP
ncbi:MAG: hypothetical protein ACUVXJ_06445 [Phycisphaerae bacterium]